MGLPRGHARYPKDRDLVRVVSAAASRVHDLLVSLDVETLDISDRAKQILRDRHETLSSHINRCAHVFAWALPSNDTPFSDLGLIAFGDGLGVLSLLAKECSIGTVVHTDMDDVLCRDAKNIARTVDSPADHYVCGDIEDVQFYVRKNSIPCDVFVSCNGIEWIEKPKRFFDTLYDLSDDEFSFGLSTRSNGGPGGSRDRCQSPGPCALGPCAPDRYVPDPFALRDEMARTGFRVELLNGQVVPRLGGWLPSGGLVLGSRFLDRLVDLVAVFAGRRAPRMGGGSGGSFILCGIRPSGVCAHVRPARNPRTVARPLRTGEVLVS